MNISFDVIDWYALAPALAQPHQWQEWVKTDGQVDGTAAVDRCIHLPMMQARRLTPGSRQAVECGLALLKKHLNVGALVFSSRHGELERNLRIQQALVSQQLVSPTDFTMSVHNAAAGSLTIAAKAALPCSSISAGEDSFQQGLFEVMAFLSDGHEQVLLIDFDGAIPDFYLPFVPQNTPSFPYAVALLLKKGGALECGSCMHIQEHMEPSVLPQSLQFIYHWLKGERSFHIQGKSMRWVWGVEHG